MRAVALGRLLPIPFRPIADYLRGALELGRLLERYMPIEDAYGRLSRHLRKQLVIVSFPFSERVIYANRIRTCVYGRSKP